MSGDTIAFGDEFKIRDADPVNDGLRVKFDPNESGKFLVLFPDDDNSDYGSVVVCQMGVD